MGIGMICPDCLVRMEDYGNMKECPHCHYCTYFGMTFTLAADIDV